MQCCVKPLLSHPSILGWLYVFVPVRTPPPPPPPPSPAADSCSRDNFWTTFWISFIFGTIVGPDLQITWLHFGRFLSWPWPRFFKVKYGICYISAKNGPIAAKRKANIAIELWGSNVTSGFDLGHDLDLEFSRSNIEFAISQPKMVRLPRNKKQTYQLNSGAQMWPVGLSLAMTLTLNFSRSNIEFAISQPKMVRLPRNEKQTYWLNSRPQMWPMVWIYQIVTGVTSVVGVPSTHLVSMWIWNWDCEAMTVFYLCHIFYQGSICACASQWEKTLQYNIISHWLGTCTDRSLVLPHVLFDWIMQ